nr:MAG TPA: hypothetical protein [Caudoviricetes sp.]
MKVEFLWKRNFQSESVFLYIRVTFLLKALSYI